MKIAWFLHTHTHISIKVERGNAIEGTVITDNTRKVNFPSLISMKTCNVYIILIALEDIEIDHRIVI